MYLSYLYTVEPLWATTSHKRPLKSKILKFSQSKPYGRNLSYRNTSRKRPQQLFSSSFRRPPEKMAWFMCSQYVIRCLEDEKNF